MNEYENRKELIGTRIKTERERKGLSKKELLKEIYMAESSIKTLSAWENGSRIPDLNSLARMAEIFQCDVGYLLGDYDTKRQQNADICQTIGLSEESVNFLRNMKQWGITSEAKIIDLLLWDAQKRNKSHHYRSITDLLAFFFKYQDKGHPSKQVFSNGAIVDYDSDGFISSNGDRFISSNAIAINSRIIENAVLMELEQALISLKKTISIKEEDNG